MERFYKQQLLESVSKLLAENDRANHEVTFSDAPLGYVKWERVVGSCCRYMSIRPLSDEYAGEYGIMWGQYAAHRPNPCEDEFDARAFGNLELILKFFCNWLIELKIWQEVTQRK